MKIYNEIITIFNDETQQWDTIFEDSFNYDGPMAMAGDVVWGDGGPGCMDESAQNYDPLAEEICTFEDAMVAPSICMGACRYNPNIDGQAAGGIDPSGFDLGDVDYIGNGPFLCDIGTEVWGLETSLCCAISNMFKLVDEVGRPLTLGVPDTSANCMGGVGVDDGGQSYSKALFKHSFMGILPVIPAIGNQECCIPHNIAGIDILSQNMMPPPFVMGNWIGNVPFCQVYDPYGGNQCVNADGGAFCDISLTIGCTNDRGQPWELTQGINLHQSQFDIDPSGATNKFMCDQIGYIVENNLDGQTVYPADGCEAFIPGTGTLQCLCPDYGGLCDPNNDNFDECMAMAGLPCTITSAGGGDLTDLYHCSSNRIFNDLYQHCSEIDGCGVCNTPGAGGAEDYCEAGTCPTPGEFCIGTPYGPQGNTVCQEDDDCRVYEACDCNCQLDDPCGACGGLVETIMDGPYAGRLTYAGGPTHYCGCGLYDSPDDNNSQLTPLTLDGIGPCYDITSLSEDPAVYFDGCPGEPLNEDCATFGAVWTDDLPYALDPGCRDDGARIGHQHTGYAACNYHVGYDLDCNSDPVAPGDTGDTDCCVYPAAYCEVGGAVYLGNASESAADASINECCDVDPYGNPLITIFCPTCDANSEGCNGGPCDVWPGVQECGSNGYFWYPYQHTSYDQIDETDLIAHIDGSLYMYAGTTDWFPLGTTYPSTQKVEILENYPSDISAGTADGYNCGNFELYGCPDPAALNSDGVPPLYSNPSFDWQAVGSSPVEVCQYCPGAWYSDSDEEPGGYLSHANGCDAGYDFYWFGDYTSGNVSSDAYITATNYPDNNWTPEWLHLTTNSTILTFGGSNYAQGSCFCRSDLTFIQTFINNTPDLSSFTPLNINTSYGAQSWDVNGRLVSFNAGGFTCPPHTQDDEVQIDNCREQALGFTGEIPTSIPIKLQTLDLSYNHLTGTIPEAIENLTSIVTLDLSYNFFTMLDQSIHYDSEDGTLHEGICSLVAGSQGVPTLDPDNNWLNLMGNRICPSAANVISTTMSFPNCLVPPVNEGEWNNMDAVPGWEQWVYMNLGYIDLPTYGNNWNTDAQDLMMPDPLNQGEYIMDCPISGCIDPRAINFWLEATADCSGSEQLSPTNWGDASCCIYDQYLHFPWGEGGDGSPGGGSWGGGMSLYQMVQALHASIFGFKYNSFGDIDVTGDPESMSGNCTWSSADYTYYLPQDVINECIMTFYNTPGSGALSTWYQGNEYIDYYDGIWLRDSGYRGESCTTPQSDWFDDCHGDMRPLEFIQRVGYQAQSMPGSEQQLLALWFLGFFPTFGADISMSGIEWFEDFLAPENYGNTNIGLGDIQYWESLGRYDIAYQMQEGWPDWGVPEFAPEGVELWETAALMVSRSYSEKFISEEDAGFTLYGTEDGSAGILRRSGQWQCSDGGNSSVCYTDVYACGRAPTWLENCTPCGNWEVSGEDTQCVPLTLDVAAEGHDKIVKTRYIQQPYFYHNLSTSISGSALYTASLSSSNNPYYYTVTNGESDKPGFNSEFSVSWGHFRGSGSDTGKDKNKGSTESTYKQWASMLLDDSEIDKGFMISSGSDITPDGTPTDRDEWIYVMNFNRNSFGDRLQKGTWTVNLSGSNTHNGRDPCVLTLTDNSRVSTNPELIGAAGERWDIISGSAGVPHTAYSGLQERFGFFYPDMGVMVFGERVADSGSGLHGISAGAANFNAPWNAVVSNYQLVPQQTENTADQRNALRFINCLRNFDGNSLTLYGEKEVTEVTYVIRLTSEQFNFTNNFSVISGSGRTQYRPGIGANPDVAVMDGFATAATSSIFTGSSGEPSSQIWGGETPTTSFLEDNETAFVWPGSNVSTMYGNQYTFITEIQLYDQYGEMVATARTSKPIKKGWDREVVIKVKLTF